MAVRALVAGDHETSEETSDRRDPSDHADEAILRLESAIAFKRERVAASFSELRRRVHRATSWRHFASAHPIVWIGAGLCFGFIIGSGGSQRRPTM